MDRREGVSDRLLINRTQGPAAPLVRVPAECDDVTAAQQTGVEALGEHHRQPGRSAAWTQFGQRFAGQGDRAGQRALQTGDRPDQRRFARTVGPQQHRDPAGGRAQVEPGQDDFVRAAPTTLIADGESGQHQIAGAGVGRAAVARTRRHAAPAARVRLRSRAMTTTGAPIAAVTTLSGSTPSLPGSCAITAHNWHTTAPISTAAGTSSR